MQVEAGTTSPGLCTLMGLPRHMIPLTRVSCNGRVVTDSAPLESGQLLELRLPLLGGKGGFGSNLRAAGKMKLTDNFDACRDLSGRRIRQQTAEKKLEEWKAQAADRALEAAAIKFAKEQAKKEKARQRVEVDERAVAEEHRAQIKSVSRELAQAVARAQVAAPAGGAKAAAPPRKRARMDALLMDQSDDSAREEEAEEALADAQERAPSPGLVASMEGPPEAQAAASDDRAPSSGESAGTQVGAETERVEASAQAEPRPAPADSNAPLPADVTAAPGESEQTTEAPLTLDEYASAGELEALGLERLKRELASRGLKAGGTLKQRAERLFLLKSTPLNELPASCFAKA